MTLLDATWKERLLEGMREFGLPRWIVVCLFAALWLVAVFFTALNGGTLLGDSLVRAGMNGVLVLARVLLIRAGNGLNFGIPLGIVAGLVGGVCVMELAAEAPFGVAALRGSEDLARGASGFWLAILVSTPLAVLLGWGYGWLLERVRGQGMMVGMYVGFGAVAGMCVIWLVAPLTSPELVWPIGGEGVRNTIVLNEHYRWVLDAWGEIQFGEWTPEQLDAQGRPPPFSRPEGFYLPTGLLLFWFGMCGAVALFLRTRLGVGMTTAGSNPRYAQSIGIRVPRMRILATVISTWLAAVGIIVYSQSYGLYQFYKAPLLMAFVIVAALLLGGASLKRATVFHVIVGTLLFQSLLTISMPVVNDLVQDSRHREALANLPEIARMIIQNGVILYALTRVRWGEQ